MMTESGRRKSLWENPRGMKKNWIKIAGSFKEANQNDFDYYSRQSKEERLNDIQFCREQYFLLKGKNENRKGLRRVYKIIKQA